MIKILSLFSGIGAFETALENLGVDHQIVGYSEIDKNASKAYSLLHNVSENLNLGDITKINTSSLPANIDLVTYGFPCQDISIAGKQNGMFDENGNKTRSGLFFDALRIIETTQPKIAIAENVKNLTSDSMRDVFDLVLSSLSATGYNNYYQIMNASDYGIPQHRERILIVSIRKDIDNTGFTFPQPIPLTSCLHDYLDENVAESYFLPDWKTKNTVIFSNTNEHKRAIIQCGDLRHYGNDQMNRIYSPYGLSPTLKTVSGGGREIKLYSNFKIRYMTQYEYLRLMGFSESAILKLREAKFSKTAIYRMAGNSIVVNVLECLFHALINEECNIFGYKRSA